MTRLVTPACSSPPSVVQRLRAAARSPMGGASLPATRTRNIQPAPGQCGVADTALRRSSGR
jgi:hypothetical protein